MVKKANKIRFLSKSYFFHGHWYFLHFFIVNCFITFAHDARLDCAHDAMIKIHSCMIRKCIFVQSNIFVPLSNTSHFYHKSIPYRSFLALSISLWNTNKFRYWSRFRATKKIIVDNVINNKHLYLHLLLGSRLSRLGQDLWFR